MTMPSNKWEEAVDNILHDFSVAESLSETQLADKLKRKIITADEYDERLVENYRSNKSQAKLALTNAVKELVETAKPEKPSNELTHMSIVEQHGFEQALADYQANLLKAIGDKS